MGTNDPEFGLLVVESPGPPLAVEVPVDERFRVLAGVTRDELAITFEIPLVGRQALQAHGTAGVCLSRRDADFGTEAVPVAVGEARRGVVEDARGVDAGHEHLGVVGVLRDDRLGVFRPVGVDVVDGRVDVLDDPNG